ncbi:MAG: hypothetical protein HKN75_06015, partial [Bacteroidia bacterium]|nr:hypothetical protein [Bacteroidia bacterium]
EQWYFVENGEFDCVNVKLKNGDSIPNEKVSLRLVDEELVLEVKVKDQNNGEGVPFTLNLFTDDLLIFDNEEHDFPQTIQYKLTHKDSCTASIIGTINNENRRVDFSLIRLPD